MYLICLLWNARIKWILSKKSFGEKSCLCQSPQRVLEKGRPSRGVAKSNEKTAENDSELYKKSEKSAQCGIMHKHRDYSDINIREAGLVQFRARVHA